MPTNEPLYDAGNAGDLLKHGLLAELVRWRAVDDSITLLDPFGGKPSHDVASTVVERVKELRDFALYDAQPEIAEGRYYGSSILVGCAAENAGKTAQVFASDKDQNTRKELADYGIDELKRDGFKPQDGYSVLDCVREGEVVLIDPFSEFLPCYANQVIPKIERVSKYASVVLFVLNLNPENRVGRDYRALKQKHLSDAWSLSCPPLGKNTGVRGESKYHVEVLLASPWLQTPSAKKLHRELQRYAAALSKILNAEVRLHPHELP